MVASDELFKLINSLDKSEKRYFHLFSQLQSGNKAYLKLFEAIEKQKVYDEEKLKRALSAELFVDRLSTEKVLLYRHILKSLELYHSHEPEFRTQSLVRHIKILLTKGLYKQCEKLLHKTKELVIEEEDFLISADLSRIEMQLAQKQGYSGRTQEYLDKIFNELQSALDKEKNLTEYRRFLIKMGMYIAQQGHVRSSEDLKVFDSMIRDPLLADEKQVLSYRAMFTFYNCHMFYHEAHYNFNMLLFYSQKKIELLEKCTWMRDYAGSYMNELWNTLVALLNLKHLDKIPLYIKKLRELPETLKGMSEYQKGLSRFFASYMEINMYHKVGNFDRAAGQVLLTEETIKENRLKLNKVNQIMLNYTSAYVYFGNGEFVISKKFLNNVFESAVKTDIISIAKIFNLIIYFEQKDETILDYVTRSTYRYLLKTKRVYEFETSILNFIRKTLPKIRTQKELLVSFKELRDELSILFKDPFEAKVLRYFDFISWLDSKIENKPFADVVREKAKAYTK